MLTWHTPRIRSFSTWCMLFAIRESEAKSSPTCSGWHYVPTVEDNGDVWLLSRSKIFQWTDGMFIHRGYFASDMDHLAIDETYAYNFNRDTVRRFKREKR